MGSNRENQRVWPAAGVLAVSALLHLSLLLLPLPGPRHETADMEPSGLRVELVAAQSPPETPDQAQPRPRPPEPEPEPEDPVRPAASSSMATTDVEEPPNEAPPARSALPAASPAEARPEAIRAQLLGAARNLGRESERSEEGSGLTYRDVPALPSQPGWLHPYTGRVTPSIDRWTGNDGSRNARVVTGSGQVFCIRTRAPTIAETFNPWMSSAVAMVSGCGRERPEGVDRADPWIRAPAGAGGLEKEQ